MSQLWKVLITVSRSLKWLLEIASFIQPIFQKTLQKAFKNLEAANVRHFCLTNDWNYWQLKWSGVGLLSIYVSISQIIVAARVWILYCLSIKDHVWQNKSYKISHLRSWGKQKFDTVALNMTKVLICLSEKLQINFPFIDLWIG